MVRFDPADGSKPTQETVKTGTLATPPQQNPVREGFRFDGWTLDNQPFDFQTPILQDTTLKAQWSKTTDWTLSPDHGPASGARLTISPPSPQEPYYTSIQSAGNQFVSLTGDGRIYTWTQDNTPKQVPSPAQAPGGFRYLQAAAGSRRQAALGSDQQIYTWTSRQPTPTILETSQNTKFSSISINGGRLLAVDQQGQIHTYQASQNPNPRFIEQAATSLPGKTQAVTAIASGSRILALDSDGQAWTWDTGKTGNIKPARIRQDTKTRIIQAQALNQGFLLLDTNGHAYHLADNMTSLTTVNLPEGMKAGSAATNKNQAMITGKDGHLWAWKPGEAPMRMDNGSQQYMQAAEADGRITAISRQGGICTWNLDEQGQPGKPVGLDTISEPTLDTVSMDGQALRISKNNGTWQADIPARNPGQATITITGRQDGQPFTRNLNYTVDQPLTRADQQSTTHTVTFNADGGSPEPADQNISNPYGRVKRPTPDPAREGYQFDGWFIGEVAYDFSKPVTKNLTLMAKWTSSKQNTWSINPDKGSQLGGQQTTITPPAATSSIKFNQTSSSLGSNSFSLAVGSDGKAYAWGYNGSGQLGDNTETNQDTPALVKKPDTETYPDLPVDFTYVQVSAGGSHSLAIGSDGYVYAWGNNQYGQLGSNATGGDNPKPVRVGTNDFGKGLKAIQVSAGERHSLAIGSDGYVYAWGYNYYGQLGNSTNERTFKRNSVPQKVLLNPNNASTGLKATQVSAGGYHSLAIDTDGNTWAWGYNEDGQLGNSINSGTDAANSVPQKVLLNPNNASTGLKATQVSAGGYHSLAIDTDGNTWAWGLNLFGQLGNSINDDTNNPNLVPQKVLLNPNNASTGLKATQVSAGGYHSLAIDTDGNTWAWGLNIYGQLGDNTTSNKSSPVKVFTSTQTAGTAEPLFNTVQVSTGYRHSLAIDTGGNTRAWGDNLYGQLGNGTTSGTEANPAPAPVMFNLQPVITGVRFDSDAARELKLGDGYSASMLTPAHLPGTVTVSVDYTLGGAAQQPDTSLRYTYLPAGVLPKAGGEGILLALATGMTGMGGVLASRRHRREQHQLSHASLE